MSAFNMADPAPTWDGKVPRCSRDDCPLYDGKRCMELGFRPDGICEPEVVKMGKELATLRANQLPANIVAAVRAYQEAHVAYVKYINELRDPGEILETHPVIVAERKTFKAVYRAIEADAKERG